MLFVAVCSLLLAHRNLLGMAAIIWSQMPFWVGSIVAIQTGEVPYLVNLGADFLCAMIFLVAAHVTDRKYLAWVSGLFCFATMVDIGFYFGLQNYVLIHEIIHYTALIIILGGVYGLNLVSAFRRFGRSSLSDR